MPPPLADVDSLRREIRRRALSDNDLAPNTSHYAPHPELLVGGLAHVSSALNSGCPTVRDVRSVGATDDGIRSSLGWSHPQESRFGMPTLRQAQGSLFENRERKVGQPKFVVVQSWPSPLRHHHSEPE
jgi:hypothetical protein